MAHRKGKAWRTVSRSIMTILLLLLVAVTTVVLLVDDSDIARFAESRVEAATGRTFQIGRLDIDWGLPTRFRASDLRLGNAPWAEQPMLQVSEGAATLALLPLLHGDIFLSDVRVEEGVLRLTRSEDNEINWTFPGRADTPKRAELPLVTDALLNDFVVEYRDRTKGSERTLVLTEVLLSSGDERVRMDVRGLLDGLPLRADAQGGDIADLRDPGRHFPLRGELAIVETQLVIDGVLIGSGADLTLDAQVALSGPDMGLLFPIAGIPAPPSEPYALNGRLSREDTKFLLSDLNLRVGESDLEGRITADFSIHPPQLTGRLAGERLDPKDIGMFLVESEAERTQILPRARIAERPLRALGIDLDVRAGVLETPFVTLHNIDAGIQLQDGRLVFDPLQVDLAGGQVNGRLRVDAVGLSGLGMDLELQGIQLGQLLPEMEPLEATRIVIGGRLRIEGEGRTIASAIGNGNGRIELVGTGGQLDSLLVAAAGLDIAKALLVAGEDEATPIRCAVAVFDVRNGIATADTAVVDTEAAVLIAEGLVNLRSETLNLEVSTRAKEPSPLYVNRPVTIQGPFRDPSFEAAGDPVAEVIGALALGALFAPAAALVPFIEPGGAEARDCRELIEMVEEAD